MLALEEIAAERADNPERARRVIVNTRDAESYQPEHLQKIEHSVLYKRREKYDPRDVLPAEVVFITFGGDLQSNRAEIKFKGWGIVRTGTIVPENEIELRIKQAKEKGERVDPFTILYWRGWRKQSWALDYRIIRGSPLQDEFWDKCENVFRNVSWRHPIG
jgi:phage terminase large subunit GpA-like protein